MSSVRLSLSTPSSLLDRHCDSVSGPHDYSTTRMKSHVIAIAMATYMINLAHARYATLHDSHSWKP